MTVTLISKVEEFQATMQHINGLAFNRTTGTVGETEAMLYIRDTLKENNISTRLEHFDYIGLKKILMRMAYAIIITYMLLFKLLIVLAFYISIKYSFPKFRRYTFLGKETSKNLIVEFPINTKEKKPVVILTAHYDSFSANLPFRLQGILFFIFKTIVVPYLCITLSLSIWILFNTDSTNIHIVSNLIFLSSISNILITFLIALMLYSTRESTGSIDNASGVSILIELTKHLKKNPLKNMDVIIIFTGAEEWGLIGAKRYLKRHISELQEKYDLDKSFNINYDMIGSYIGLMHEKGILKKKRINKSLNMYIKEAAEKLDVKYFKHSHFINPKTDHRRFLKFARKTKSKFQVACFHSAKDSKYIHSPRDTPDKCNPENLNGVFNISAEVLHKIDSEF
jgi:hypothetical protein